MRLLEYQGKELFDHYGVKVPRSFLAYTSDEAREAASKLGYPLIMKAQVTVGGRGKAGAIVKCNSQTELEPMFTSLAGKEVKGELPQGILLEEMKSINKEIYLSLFLNRGKRCYSLIASSEGGVDIESVRNKVIIDIPFAGLPYKTAEDVARKLDLVDGTAVSFADVVSRIARLVDEKEAELAEINPLAVLTDGSIVALDAKVIIDDNALFRHADLKKYIHVSDLQKQAETSGFSLVELEGNIAILGNGAGLVMSTLDLVSDAGGKAGAFLDFGGSATTETIYQALKVISRINKIDAILVNLFGGIVRTSLVAQAIIDAYKDKIINVPVFARISGAESEKAKQMLNGSKAWLYDSVEQAIKSVVTETTQME